MLSTICFFAVCMYGMRYAYCTVCSGSIYVRLTVCGGILYALYARCAVFPSNLARLRAGWTSRPGASRVAEQKPTIGQIVCAVCVRIVSCVLRCVFCVHVRAVYGTASSGWGRGGIQFVHGHSRMTIDPRNPTMRGPRTLGFHQPDRHCLYQARSAVRCSASRMKGELHPSKNRS